MEGSSIRTAFSNLFQSVSQNLPWDAHSFAAVMGLLDLRPFKGSGPSPSKQQYQQVEKGELLDEHATFLSDSESNFPLQRRQRQKTRYLQFLTLINLLILAISILTNCSRYLFKAPLSTDSAVRKVSYYCT